MTMNQNELLTGFRNLIGPGEAERRVGTFVLRCLSEPPQGRLNIIPDSWEALGRVANLEPTDARDALVSLVSRLYVLADGERVRVLRLQGAEFGAIEVGLVRPDLVARDGARLLFVLDE